MAERVSGGLGGAKAGWLTGAAAVLLLGGCDAGAANRSATDRTVADRAPAGTTTKARPAGTAADATAAGGGTTADPKPIGDEGRSADAFWNLDAGSRTVVATGGARRSALFLCDALAEPVALALTVPDGEGRADFVVVPDAGRSTDRVVTVGLPDPGAGNIHFPLTADGRGIGDVHAVNTGILQGNTVPTVRAVTLDGATHECRWAPHTRVLAVTSRRTVLVTGRHGQGQLRYRTFDHGARLARLEGASAEQGTEASLDLTGGREVGGAYRFRNEGYEYRLDPGAATLTVVRDGKAVQTEPLLAWTVGGTATPDG